MSDSPPFTNVNGPITRLIVLFARLAERRGERFETRSEPRDQLKPAHAIRMTPSLVYAVIGHRDHRHRPSETSASHSAMRARVEQELDTAHRRL